MTVDVTWLMCVADAPGEPMAPCVRDIHSSSCTVTCQPPLVEGGTAVTAYLLEYKSPHTESWLSLNRRPVTASTVKIRNLHPHTLYQFRVAAWNAGSGAGEFSSASVSITTDDSKPTRPGCPVVLTDGTSVDVEWTMACDDGGPTDCHYIIRVHYQSDYSDGRMFIVTERKAGAVVRHSLPIELQQDVIYDFAVAAVNEVGVGPYSLTSLRVTGQFSA